MDVRPGRGTVDVVLMPTHDDTIADPTRVSSFSAAPPGERLRAARRRRRLNSRYSRPRPRARGRARSASSFRASSSPSSSAPEPPAPARRPRVSPPAGSAGDGRKTARPEGVRTAPTHPYTTRDETRGASAMRARALSRGSGRRRPRSSRVTTSDHALSSSSGTRATSVSPRTGVNRGGDGSCA